MLIGVALVGFGVKSLLDNERFMARAAVADGVVVGVVEVVERSQRGSRINAQEVEETKLHRPSGPLPSRPNPLRRPSPRRRPAALVGTA
jgi:hypothetical protein